MRLQDYPPQEPASGAANEYRGACIAGSFGVAFSEISFGADPHQSLAVYPGQHRPGPLFAFLHGGGWDRGYKETMGFMAPAFTEAGITFASIGYRLAPDHVFPSGVEDAVSALRILYERANSFGHDRNSIYVGGHSAGGHYASLLAIRRDWQAANAMPLNVIKGCLPISGVYRFGPGSGLAKRPRFLGPEGNGADHAASPVLHINDPPPFLIAYGEKDFPHLILQAEEMIGALRQTGASVETMRFPGRDHFTASLAGGERDGPWVPRALAFIRSRKRE